MIKKKLVKVYYAVSILWRGALAMILGAIVCKLPLFRQYKRHLLSTWHDFDKRKGVDNLLFGPLFNFWIRFEYLREKDPDKRESLKELAMGGNSGRKCAKQADAIPLDFNAKIGDMTFNEAFPMFSEIENILEGAKARLIVIQVGSSSGREIAYFAHKYPAHTYIGADICQEIADYASSAHQSQNLSFRTLSAKHISQLLSEYKNENILIFSSGALTYMQPEHLPVFFSSVANMASAKILLNEPGRENRGKLPDEVAGSMWRGNFTYTHDYKFYAEKANIKTVKSRVIRLPYPIYYFYYGETNGCHW
ncbi:MAG: hypothetical protein CL875_02945 [Dehalococcoidales bacterium]|nr:hypothetical protein [Dehalococcoidales bacterium]|tara:strand:+ start:2270 stop:3190 length:921 start_codon:yes stop_codon:yes gene_type:complete